VLFDGRNVLLSGSGGRYWAVDTVSRRSVGLELPETDPPANRFAMSFVRGGTELWSIGDAEGPPIVLRFRPVYASVQEGDVGSVVPERNRSDLDEYKRRADSKPHPSSGPR